MTVYRDDHLEPTRPQQARDDRPNPRWPQNSEVEALVARVRSAIASNPAILRDAHSPVADLVSDVTDDLLVAAEVVEGVLADSACRWMLSGVGLHCAVTPKRRAKR